jgi:phosphotransferase system HPr-like phosphotransfer protein
LVERGGLHARLTELLCEQASGADALRLNALARHSTLAVPFDLDACVLHCRRAAQAARDASGFEAAAALSRGALEQLEALGGAGELRCEVMFELGLDQFCAGEIQAGRETLERGARLARELGATPWLARFACRLALWGDVGAIDSELRSMIDEGLEPLGDDEVSSDLRAVLLARRAELGWDLEVVQRRELSNGDRT